MNHETHDRLYQAVLAMYPADFIGYSQESQKRFREGFLAAVEGLYNIESNLVSDSIAQELGID